MSSKRWLGSASGGDRVGGNPEVVLDDTIGRLIPARDAADLAFGRACWQRVEDQFGFRRQMAARYEALDEGGAPTDTACEMPTVP